MDTARFATFLLLLQSLFSVSFAASYGSLDAKADAANKLRAIERAALDLQLEMNPLQATQYGSYAYNDLIAVYTEKDQARHTRRATGLLRELRTINIDNLDEGDKVNLDVLDNKLGSFVLGNEWALYGSLTPVTMFENQLFYVNMAPTRTLGDYENFIARLEAVPKQVGQMKQFCRKAISLGRTLHNDTMLPVIPQLERYIVDAPEKSTYYFWFGEPLEQSNVRSNAKRRDIRARGKAAISKFIKAVQNLRNFLVKTYLPNTRTELGVGSWPDDFYWRCIEWHLSQYEDPDILRSQAEGEVDRITGRMKKTMRRLNFRGTPRQFFEHLKGDPRFFVNDMAVVGQKYREAVARIQARINDIFEDAPEYPLIVSANPGGRTAYYGRAGAGYDSSPGKLYINTADPQIHPLYQVMSLSLDIVLGQHMQHSYVLLASLPVIRWQNFGQFINVPFMMPTNNYHAEGWRLFAQYLGEEMDLFADDYELMGWYSSEILQASRMVVDTGLHHFNWTRQEAIDYMEKKTTASMAGIEREIDLIIAYPGQGVAGTWAKLQMKKLQRLAKKELGEDANMAGFHSALLKHGLLPRYQLSAQVNNWIEEQLQL